MDASNNLVNTLHEWLELFRRSLMGTIFTYARDNGLTMAQLGTLFHITHRGACGVSEIGSDLGVTNSAASQMLERLVQLHLVTRTEDLNDRRVKQIVLTEKGIQIVRESSVAFHAWIADLAGSMTSEEQETVRRALVILIDKARQLEKTPI